MEGYRGRIETVRLALWRGACSVEEFEIRKVPGEFKIKIDSLQIAIAWSKLFHGALVGKVLVKNPRLTLVVRKPSEAPKKVVQKSKQAEADVKKNTGKPIPQAITDLIPFPFDIDQFEIRNGTVFISESIESDSQTSSGPKEGPLLTETEVFVTNLTNSLKLSKSLVSTVDAKGKINGSGLIHLTLKIDPTAKEPRFDLAVETQKIDLEKLNRFLEWQTKLHFIHGTFAMDAEASAADGRFQGYVKPFIEDLKVESAGTKPTVAQKAKKFIVNAAAVIFKNKDTDKVATKIPFEGRFHNPETDIWQAALALLRNAFIEAIKPGLDPSIHLDLS